MGKKNMETTWQFSTSHKQLLVRVWHGSLLSLGKFICRTSFPGLCLTFPLFCFFDKWPNHHILIWFIFLLLFSPLYLIFLFSSAFSLSTFLLYISMGFYCIPETLSIIVTIPWVSSPWKKCFISWNNYHLCSTFTFVYVHLTSPSPGNVTP